MKTIRLTISLLCLFLALGGCKTSPEVVAYKSLSSLVIAVDNAKLAYYDYRETAGVSVENDFKVKTLYLRYQRVMALVEKTYYTTKGTTVDPELIKVGEEFIRTVKQIISGPSLIKQ